jgi:hypothetical protein
MPSTIAKKVRADSSETIELLFYPTGSNMGLFDFTATVESLNNPDVKASAKFFINIPYLAAIKGFSASASGNTVSFYAILKTPEEKELKGEFALEDSSGITVGSVPFTETVNGDKGDALSPGKAPGRNLHRIHNHRRHPAKQELKLHYPARAQRIPESGGDLKRFLQDCPGISNKRRQCGGKKLCLPAENPSRPDDRDAHEAR